MAKDRTPRSAEAAAARREPSPRSSSEAMAEDAAETLELRIERLAAGGEGVARDARGRVVFVPQTAPGDRVRVAVEQARPRFARARLVELLEPGPGRTDPVCPVFGTCGGCQWQHLDAATQREAKSAILREAWTRIGRLPDPGPVPTVPSPRGYGWRARARVGVRGGQVGFRRAGTHRICAIAHCPVLVPELDARLAALAAREREAPTARGEERTLAVGDAPAPGGGPGIGLRAGPDVLRASPDAFFQANALLRGRLAEAVWEAAGEGAAALELFAGIGFFTLGLARRFGKVVAVEGHPAAASDLRANLERAGLAERVRVEAAPAERALARSARAAEPLDAVVLDPPRRGLMPEARRALAALPARRIVYVSCDPATLARDVAELVAGGARVRALRGFDLFPQTAHVEALAVLEREARAGR